jgi:hypothetical protein
MMKLQLIMNEGGGPRPRAMKMYLNKGAPFNDNDSILHYLLTKHINHDTTKRIRAAGHAVHLGNSYRCGIS